jgi:ribosome-binding ATPase YchF (GTP1/OBG family)
LTVIKELHFLTDKPVIFCANISEEDLADAGESNNHVKTLKEYASSQGCETVVICAQMEADMAGLSDEERTEFLSSYGLKEGGLDKTIALAYSTLGLASYFTAGPKEAHAWTFQRGWKAPKCASVIHTDFERGFIRAEVIAFEDFVKNNGVAGARAAGALRPEGKEYEMQDGDVVEFLFNV